MGLKAFLRENAKQPENLKVLISDRFIGEDGTPEQWEIRALSEKENNRLKDSCTTKAVKRGVQTKDFNSNLYVQRLNAACVVYPDLMDAQLQESYGVVGSEKLLVEMLLPGEYAALSEVVSQINHFDLEEAQEEIKNS